MNIIVCIDKKNGMMFNKRRQSQDKQLIDKIINIVDGACLLVSKYSFPLFSNYSNIKVTDDFDLDYIVFNMWNDVATTGIYYVYIPEAKL